ncbi:hypothetical protein [Pseudomonas fulva]|nr:hypothetical protein [Pseudomonas fulva]MBF8779324.1 hypothetical protein [Pseudomonas fulva]
MQEQDRNTALTAWRLLLEDDSYRLDWPDDYYRTLMTRADELVLSQLISLEDWQLLKDAADTALDYTRASLERQQRDRLNTATLKLPGA